MTKPLILDSVCVRDFNSLELLSPMLNLSYEMQTSSTACKCSGMPSDSVTYDSAICNKIYVETLTSEELVKAVALGLQYPGLSFEDYTVLYIAHRDGNELVTGDKLVSRVAGSMHIVVHDYMWVLEEMITAGNLDITDAIHKYDKLHTTVNPLAIWEKSVTPLYNAYQRRQKLA